MAQSSGIVPDLRSVLNSTQERLLQSLCSPLSSRESHLPHTQSFGPFPPFLFAPHPADFLGAAVCSNCLVGLPVVAHIMLRCDVTEAIKGFFVAVTVDKSTQRKDLCVFSVLLHPTTSSKLQPLKLEL